MLLGAWGLLGLGLRDLTSRGTVWGLGFKGLGD